MITTKMVLWLARKFFLLAFLSILFFIIVTSTSNSKNHPNDITQQFILVTQNPTDVISGEDKKIINSIFETSLLKNLTNEIVIKSIRKLEMKSTRKEISIKSEENNQYSTAIIQYFDDQDKEFAKVELYMQTSSKLVILKQTKIFHLEIIPGQNNLDIESVELLENNFKDIKKKLESHYENFTKQINLNY